LKKLPTCNCVILKLGFLGGSDSKELACNAGDTGNICWRREWLPTPVLLPGESGREEPGKLQSMG